MNLASGWWDLTPAALEPLPRDQTVELQRTPEAFHFPGGRSRREKETFLLGRLL